MTTLDAGWPSCKIMGMERESLFSPRTSGRATDEQVLALARAAERLGKEALRWMPYADECPERLRAERDADEILVEKDLRFVRARLKEVEFAILVSAEERGNPQ